MRRREFLSVAGGVAAWPLGALGQQAPMPVIGFLSSFTKPLTEKRIAAFGRGLAENGYAVGRNVALELRTADNQFERLPALAAELVAKRVRLIATLAQPALDAARAATSTTPIVFVAASDPVKSGAVRSLARPGGNVTGVTFLTSTLGAKRLEVLREIAPRGAFIAVLVNPTFPESMTELQDVEAAATSMQQPLAVFNANSDKEIELAFAEMQRRRAGALLVGTGGLFVQRSALLTSLADRHRIPALYPTAEAPAVGGLMSYGASIEAAWVQAGVYAGRILKGAKPADLPVVQPDKVELVLNAKAARALGITFPPTLVARADEVIR